MGVVLIGFIIAITALGALYWIFYGQRKHEEMMNPKRKTELKAILFDFDGVIVDSFEAWFKVFNKIRKEYNLKEIKKDYFLKKRYGEAL